MGLIRKKGINMQLRIDDDFDLLKIINSGQCFRAALLPDDVFRFVSGGCVLYIKKETGDLFDVSCSDDEWERIWRPYFDLDRNYRRIRESLPGDDPIMKQAADAGQGIRVLR
ncbi:MAG: 8-oxoguanine DNA glycosylase, N-terminal domain-containing protein, partial [Bacteroidales bacterium]|nr:8-oxoguanine DNA glycosylase, N-terminal domain-containing protein [Bacteroidales bacterium]